MGTHLRYLRSSRQVTTPVTTAFNRYTRSTYSTLILRPPPTPPPLPLIPSTCVSLLLSLPLAPPSALAPAPLPLPPARPTPALPTRPTSAPLLVSWLSSASSPLSKFLS